MPSRKFAIIPSFKPKKHKFFISGILSIVIIIGLASFSNLQFPQNMEYIELEQQTLDSVVMSMRQTITVPAAFKSIYHTFTNRTKLTPNLLPTPTVTLKPIHVITARISTMDNEVLIYIPPGDFIMGSNDHASDESTKHTVHLDGYWIYQDQVTNIMYARCVNMRGCGYNVIDEINPRFKDPAFANHPVVFVFWQDAMDYCNWVGGRLPTEAEWEKAALGEDGSTYPWGDEHPDPGFANVFNYFGDTRPVGNFPNGRSEYGVLDMGSNVREWVFDWYDPDYYLISPRNNPKGPETGETKVLKGAAFGDPYQYAKRANRLNHVPNSPGINRGFRCVVPAQ
jgi:formylglycine-generating enzyme required for sulfatase activity